MGADVPTAVNVKLGDSVLLRFQRLLATSLSPQENAINIRSMKECAVREKRIFQQNDLPNFAFVQASSISEVNVGGKAREIVLSKRLKIMIAIFWKQGRMNLATTVKKV